MGVHSWSDEECFHIKPAKPIRIETASVWRKMVEAYTRLQFTNTSDLLPALGGIVEREMRSRIEGTYVAGMWTNSLLEDLCFHFPRENITKRDTMPTWSWTSLCGRVDFWCYDPLPVLKLVGINFTRTTPAKIGGVTDASITLRGPHFLAMVVNHEVKFGLEILRRQPTGQQFNIETDSLFRSVHRIPGNLVTILLLSSFNCYGISLGIVLGKGATGKVERIGCVQLSRRSTKADSTEALNRWIDELSVQEFEIF